METIPITKSCLTPKTFLIPAKRMKQSGLKRKSHEVSLQQVFTTFTVVKELLNFKFPMINTLKLIKIKRYYFVNHTDILQSFIFDFCVIFTLPFLSYSFFFLFFQSRNHDFGLIIPYTPKVHQHLLYCFLFSTYNNMTIRFDLHSISCLIVPTIIILSHDD